MLLTEGMELTTNPNTNNMTHVLELKLGNVVLVQVFKLYSLVGLYRRTTTKSSIKINNYKVLRNKSFLWHLKPILINTE